MPDYWFYKFLELEKQFEAENWRDIARLATLKLGLVIQELKHSLEGIDKV